MTMRSKSALHAYQDQIIAHLYERDEAIAVVRPGGGKTVAALTATTELLRDKVVRHALVVAPKRVARSVWPDEIAGWEHLRHLDYAVLSGTPPQRLAMLETARGRDLTIIGIDVLPWLLDKLAVLPDDHPLFELLVIDEVSKLRDPTGVRVKALARMASRWKMIWGLTGTLRPSGPLDLFMPVRVVTRGRLWGKSYYQWRGKHFYPIDRNQYEWQALPGAEENLNRALAGLVCIPELPPQPQPTVVIDHVELPSEARRSYNRMQRNMFALGVEAESAAVATGKLAQIANGFIYDGGDDDTITTLIHDEKYEWLRDIVEDATGPTILIYEFRQDLQVMRGIVGADLPCLGAGGSSDMAAIADWNAGRLRFLAMHPASGGHGLNLQHGGADMAWMSPTWSPELWEQTIARLNRPGQTRQVIVRVCVAVDTVDGMKLDRVHHKMSAQEAFEAYLRHMSPLRVA